MSLFKNRRILIGVTGSIAAFKTLELISELNKQGAELRIILTKSAEKFVTPLSFQAFCPNQVYTDLWTDPMAHIHLAKWADLVLIAPASANCMARMVAGFADDLLYSMLLATSAPVVLAPAMNQAMWRHVATQENYTKLQTRGVFFLGPNIGLQACGDIGPGRMCEVEDMLDALPRFSEKPFLAGKKVLITAGPTEEALDPVRCLTNRSSGKMGYALAKSAYHHGAEEVILVSGPTALKVPACVTHIPVRSALEMREAVLKKAPQVDLLIAAAAIGDFSFCNISAQKLKKSQIPGHFQLMPNPDILVEVSALPDKPVLVGFAAETEHLLENATAKLLKKNLDFIIANQVGEGLCFGEEEQEVFMISADQSVQHFPKAPKSIIAQQILQALADFFQTEPGPHRQK